MPWDFIYLASGSPRRRELLEQIGVPFRVLAGEVDERSLAGEAAPEYVSRLAVAKARAGWASAQPEGRIPVLAADTSVILDGVILGKPSDRRQGLDMLRRLSGRKHEVLTAVALCSAAGTESRLSRSEVTFRAISPAEAEAYWLTGEPLDKAGAYAIQGRAALFIAHLSGSYSGVMGLPLFETAELLAGAGFAPWHR